MNQRINRIRHLSEELAEAMDALAVETRASDVVVFLDRLARLEGFENSELLQVPGLTELIADASAARTAHADDLAKVAGWAFDLDQLLEEGRRLSDAEVKRQDRSVERDCWLRDLLLLATVAPWLTRARRAQAGWAIEEAMAIIDCSAEDYLDASVLATDRHECESPNTLGTVAQGLLQLLTELPLTVAFERAPAAPNSEMVANVLSTLDQDLLESLEYALRDRVAAARVRLPGKDEHLRLAAAETDTIVLIRVQSGRWFVTSGLGERKLSFEFDEGMESNDMDVSVRVERGEALGALSRDEEGKFLLPQSSTGLDLILRVGPDSSALRIAAAES